MRVFIYLLFASAMSTGAGIASISVHGSSTAYTETGGDWLSMDSNDIDESGGLGTDGFIFFGDFNNASNNNRPFSHHVEERPSYVTSFAAGANFVSVADEFNGYGAIDDPNTLDGTNRRSGFAIGTTGAAGASNEIVLFTINNLSDGAVVRVGVLAGVEGNSDGRWDPTSITLSGGGDSATVGDHATSQLSPNPGGSNSGWVFFDLDQDGSYAVSVTKRRATQGAGVAGLTFDSLAGVLDLSDPTDSDGDGMGDNWETFFFGDLSRSGLGDFYWS